MGHIPKNALESSLIPKLQKALAEKLHELKTDPDLVKDYTMEALIIYLEKGAKHWSLSYNFDPLDLWNAAMSNHWSELIRFLISSATQTNVVHRIVTIISQREYEKFIRKLRASDAEFVIKYTADAHQVAVQEKPNQESVLRRAIWRLIIIDLIKNYSSLFNRKMFIKRQLIALSSAFQLAYLDILRIFEEKYSQLKTKSASTYDLPRLISSLRDEVNTPPTPSNKPDTSSEWEKWLTRTQKPAVPQPQWQKWIKEYPSEFKKSIEQIIKTTLQVEGLANQVPDERIDEIITILTPEHSDFILSYKATVVTNHQSKPLTKSRVSDFKQAISTFILVYLLVDRGSRFNQKEFIKHQVIRLSHHYNLSSDMIIKYLVDGLKSLQIAGYKRLVDLILSLQDEVINTNEKNSEFNFQFDQQEYLKYYLTTGLIKSSFPGLKTETPKHLTTILAQLPDESFLILTTQNSRQIKEASSKYEDDFFLLLVQKLLTIKLGLEPSENRLVFDAVKKSLRQAIQPISYRMYVLSTILDFGNRLQKQHIQQYDLDSKKDPHSLLARYFSVKFSIEEYYKISDSSTSLTPGIHSTTNVSYQEAFTHIVNSLPELAKEKQKKSPAISLIRQSLMKIIESELEIEMLFSHFSESQLHLLQSILTSTERQKLTKKLSAHLRLSNDKLKKLKIDSEQLIKILIRLFKKPNKKLQSSDFKDLRIVIDQPELLNQNNSNPQKYSIKNEDQWLLIVEFLNTGKQPNETTVQQLEFVLLKYFTYHYREIQAFLTRLSPDRILLEKWTNTLSSNVLMRFVQAYTQQNFNHFSKLSDQLEYFLKKSGFSITRQFTSKDYLHIRLHMAYYYKTIKLSVEQIATYYIYHLGSSLSKNTTALKKEFIEKLASTNLPTKYKEKLREKLTRHFQETAEVQPAEPEAKSATNDDSQEQHHYTNYAGLVLFWPFLKRLFDALEYLTVDSQFKDISSQARAVRLLHHLAAETPNAPEYEMTLNKILCGMPFSEPLGSPITLTDKETELADSMILGLIQNWDKLGNTTPEGLRNSFIQREGAIDRDERNWIVRIEKKGIDILLDYIPWSISSFKLPWTEGMIYVEWR